MGLYINPGNEGFRTARNGLYVDKSGLVAAINATIDTPTKLTLVSRPRRFGKSFAAKMLCAYYDRSCRSSGLFDDLAIARDASYRAHLNRYNVLYLDITGFVPDCPAPGELVRTIMRLCTADVRRAFPDVPPSESFSGTLAGVVEATGAKFVAVIDEWDAPVRAAYPREAQQAYLEFLRSLFKNSGITDKVFAAAYMTGILPIKKDGSQSAISEFREYTMLAPRGFASYVGFTEGEVRRLCGERGADFAVMRRWYDGYALPGAGSVYNPNSVVMALQNRSFESYWQQSSAADSLLEYIALDYDGLGRAVAELMGGVRVPVDAHGFQNDTATFATKDDVLTLLIHFGYLSYDAESGTARIPNEEIRMEFARAVRRVRRDETVRRVRESDALIEATAAGDAEAVAAQLEKVHAEECAPLFYNSEQSLRSVVKLAYFAYRDRYVKMEELPGGRGYADIAYIPRPGSGMPALVVELKADGTDAAGAIAQIRERGYAAALAGLVPEPPALPADAGVLLVGISYDRKTRKHSCTIEPLEE